MKRNICLFLLVVALSVVGQQPDCSVQIHYPSGETVFKTGKPIVFKVETTCPEGYVPRGWNVYTHSNYVPETFADQVGGKIQDKWNTIKFHQWTWFPAQGKSFSGELSTAQWPKGDYKLILMVIFRNEKKATVQTDRYLQTPMLFTLEN